MQKPHESERHCQGEKSESGHISQKRTSCATEGGTGGCITQRRNCVQGWNTCAVFSVRQEHCGKSSDLCIYNDTNGTTDSKQDNIYKLEEGVPLHHNNRPVHGAGGGGGITDQFSCYSRSTNWQINYWTCRHFSKLDKASPSAAAWRW